MIWDKIWILHTANMYDTKIHKSNNMLQIRSDAKGFLHVQEYV